MHEVSERPRGISPGGCLLALLALAWFVVFLVVITGAFAGVERQLGGWVIAGFAILSAELIQLGFRRLTWSDGRDASWSHDLAPAPDEAAVLYGLEALGLGVPLRLEAPEAP